MALQLSLMLYDHGCLAYNADEGAEVGGAWALTPVCLVTPWVSMRQRNGGKRRG